MDFFFVTISFGREIKRLKEGWYVRAPVSISSCFRVEGGDGGIIYVFPVFIVKKYRELTGVEEQFRYVVLSCRPGRSRGKYGYEYSSCCLGVV